MGCDQAQILNNAMLFPDAAIVGQHQEAKSSEKNTYMYHVEPGVTLSVHAHILFVNLRLNACTQSKQNQDFLVSVYLI